MNSTHYPSCGIPFPNRFFIRRSVRTSPHAEEIVALSDPTESGPEASFSRADVLLLAFSAVAAIASQVVVYSYS
jgi:hypothetical protein